GPVFHTIVSIKNDGHYFCRAGGNRPDGLNEPVTNILIGLIRCFYERLMLLTIFAARLICINLEFDIVFPVIKSFEFWS
ncbi:hypothetical protein, partial [Klebsiella pneumoniae]|uniref:hypothetical protein n=1 Tax=Klebsiella pneumoniae TaxID=573 RepID=UPI0021197E57